MKTTIEVPAPANTKPVDWETALAEERNFCGCGGQGCGDPWCEAVPEWPNPELDEITRTILKDTKYEERWFCHHWVTGIQGRDGLGWVCRYLNEQCDDGKVSKIFRTRQEAEAEARSLILNFQAAEKTFYANWSKPATESTATA
jgi:hypothetical protein